MMTVPRLVLAGIFQNLTSPLASGIQPPAWRNPFPVKLNNTIIGAFKPLPKP